MKGSRDLRRMDFNYIFLRESASKPDLELAKRNPLNRVWVRQAGVEVASSN